MVIFYYIQRMIQQQLISKNWNIDVKIFTYYKIYKNNIKKVVLFFFLELKKVVDNLFTSSNYSFSVIKLSIIW
jgi:hypothetical protein